jgi:hypothetical protein
MDHFRAREMGWSKRQHIQISADSFSPSQRPKSCVLACVLQQRSHLSGRYTILISIVDPECRESQRASGRAHAGRCSKLLTNCSPPARRRDGEYRAGLVASTVKRQSPEASKLVPLPQPAIYSLPAIYERQLPLVDVILQLLCPIRSGPRQHGRRHRKP